MKSPTPLGNQYDPWWKQSVWVAYLSLKVWVALAVTLLVLRAFGVV